MNEERGKYLEKNNNNWIKVASVLGSTQTSTL
jgi:hypothetical protein